VIQRPHRRVLAGFIGIETEHDFIDVPFQDASVFGGERGALRRHHVLDAGHETRDQIQLTFADHGVPASNRARFDLSSPKNTLLLTKIGVSGEFTYLASSRPPPGRVR